jgi:hypothetical protein
MGQRNARLILQSCVFACSPKTKNKARPDRSERAF